MNTQTGRRALQAVIVITCSALGAQESGIVSGVYAPIWEAAHNEQWSNVVFLCERAARVHADAMASRVTNALPLGFLVDYQHGRALMRLGASAADAYERLQHAAGWLASADPQHEASNAWCALYAMLGQSCRALSRYYDAQVCFEQAAAFTCSTSWEWVQLRLDVIELDDARGRVAVAEAAIAHLWHRSSFASRRLAGRYAFHLLSAGKRSQAMRIALDGIAEHGVRAYLHQDDPLLCAALLAQDEHTLDEVSELYDILGLQLETLELDRNAEDTCVLLINQRRLLAECYPHLAAPRDVEALRARCRIPGPPGQWTSASHSEEWHVD